MSHCPTAEVQTGGGIEAERQGTNTAATRLHLVAPGVTMIETGPAMTIAGAGLTADTRVELQRSTVRQVEADQARRS
jgi:hypothetical protein